MVTSIWSHLLTERAQLAQHKSLHQSSLGPQAHEAVQAISNAEGALHRTQGGRDALCDWFWSEDNGFSRGNTQC